MAISQMTSVSPLVTTTQFPELGGRRAGAPVDEIFLNRWSRRAFSTQAIPPGSISTLFEAARWAPSASNSQPWLFVYNDDEASLAKARPLIIESNRRWADKAPLLIFTFARRNSLETGKPLRTALFDTGAAWFSLALQAHKLGLVTRAMGGIHHDKVYETLGVPQEEFESVAGIAVGYPAARESLHVDLQDREVPNPRRAVNEFAFKGRYQP